MKSRETIMQDIFSSLSDRNKEIMILLAQSIKVTQETDTLPNLSSKSVGNPNVSNSKLE